MQMWSEQNEEGAMRGIGPKNNEDEKTYCKILLNLCVSLEEPNGCGGV